MRQHHDLQKFLVPSHDTNDNLSSQYLQQVIFHPCFLNNKVFYSIAANLLDFQHVEANKYSTQDLNCFDSFENMNSERKRHRISL